MATTQQGYPQIQRSLTEEKYFDLPYEQGAPLVRQAVSHALGIELKEDAPGMWSGSKDEGDGYGVLDVTVRVLRVDRGMSVEIRLDSRFNRKAATWGTIGIIIGCLLLVPLIPVIAISQRVQKRQRRDRFVSMHVAWNEISEAIGAPRRASYREQPVRAYAPMRIAQTDEAVEQAAAEEQAELDAEPERARG